MALSRWTFIAGREVAQTRIFKLLAETWRSPRTGEELTFTNIDSVDFVNVLAVDTEERLVMIRQFRFGTREFTLEVPGGMCEVGEDPAQTAPRELREETGYVGGVPRYLGYVETNPAIFNNRAHMFLIEGCTFAGDPTFDAGEDIEVLLKPVDEALAMNARGDITHALVSVALSRLDLHRRGQLRLPADLVPRVAQP